MPLANYSTRVNHTKTVAEIEHLLLNRGIRRVIKDLDESGSITSIQFIIVVEAGTYPFKLPVDVEACYFVLDRQRRDGEFSDHVSMEKARNVVWRIIKDWIRMQLAMIDTGMVVIEQVFLPYLMIDESTTIFQALQDGRLPLALGSGQRVSKGGLQN